MTEPNQNELDTKAEKPKISLQEAIRRKLAEKKQAQAKANNPVNQKAKNQTMKSQLTKKPNNQRRRMGV